MNTKTTASIFACFLAVFLMISFTGASVLELDLIDAPVTAIHGSEVTITFNVSAEGATMDYTELNWSESSANLGCSWKTLPSRTSINQGEVFVETAVLIIPEHQSGTINAIIDLQSETSAEDQLPITITINETPSLSLTTDKLLTKISNGTLIVKNTGNKDLAGISLAQTSSADFTVSFSDSNFALSAGDSKSVTVSSNDVADLEVGDDNTLNIKAVNSLANSSQVTLEVPISFCEGVSNAADQELSLEIEVTDGFGDDEEYWYPFDEVELELEIENGDYDTENIEIKFCLYDETQGTCVLDEGDVDISEDDFDLDEGDDIITRISFRVDPDDLKEGNTKYKIYLSAIGEIDDNDDNAEDDGVAGDNTCVSIPAEIEIRTGENFVIVDDIEIQETIQCGSSVTLTADVWNVGDNDMDDDEVYLWLFNEDLGINELIEFEDGIDAFEYESFVYTFEVPEGLQEKYYEIKLTAYDDDEYDEDDIYENSEDDEAEFNIIFKVEGNCGVTQSLAVSATLESEAMAGEELIVQATITNAGDETATFDLDVSGYSSWAESLDIEDESFTLDSGSSKDIALTFLVEKDAEGNQDFDIEISSDGELVKTQPVQVSIEVKEGFWNRITGAVTSDGEGSVNWYVWGIALLNIILIIVIIVVAVRIARR